MRIYIFISLFLFFSASFGSTNELNDYSSHSLKKIQNKSFSLSYPSTWHTRKDPFLSECTLLYSPHKTRQEDFTLRVCFREGMPIDILGDMGFVKDSGKWFATGSMDRNEANIVMGNKYVISGLATCGVSDQAGFHAAGGNCYRAVVLGKTHSITFESSGTTAEFKVIESIY